VRKNRPKTIEIGAFGTIRIDIRTVNPGTGSAIKQHVDDPDTDVSFGKIHARVTFKDLNLEVTMDPREGKWTDAKWARREAWAALGNCLNVKEFATIMNAVEERGRKSGEAQAKLGIRRALGIKEPNFTGGHSNA
jgi:hypothetical protein